MRFQFKVSEFLFLPVLTGRLLETRVGEGRARPGEGRARNGRGTGEAGRVQGSERAREKNTRVWRV